MQARITLPFVGTTPCFEFSKGGKQGGIETPDEWRAVLDYVFEPVIDFWNASGFGFMLPDSSGAVEVLVNHAIWADNVILFGRTYEMMQTLIEHVNVALSKYVDLRGRQYFC